ncbi:MAG: DNA repair exonuclease, partial [Mesorhizobium sp.]
SEAFRAEARAFVQKMVADLPADGRDFAGTDEAGLEQFLDQVLSKGADLVTARLKAGGSS